MKELIGLASAIVMLLMLWIYTKIQALKQKLPSWVWDES